MTIEMVIHWLQHRAGGLYGGEAITQREHALQCATLAVQQHAADALVVAALLHDLGHLADSADDARMPHAEHAAALLQPLFSAAVTEPIRLHVSAKRYLCAVDPVYWSTLSDESKRSLEWQGGKFDHAGAVAFIKQPFAQDAVQLRRWDDAAKEARAPTLPLSHFFSIMSVVAIPQGVAC